MAVPGHDERDHEFAEKFELPIIEVIEGGDVQTEAYTGNGPHVNSGELNGLYNDEAISKAIELLEANQAGEKRLIINYVIGCLVDNDIGENQFQLFIGKMDLCQRYLSQNYHYYYLKQMRLNHQVQVSHHLLTLMILLMSQMKDRYERSS